MSKRRIASLEKRIEKHDAKVEHFEQRDGPPRRKGEKVGEYHERVKIHDRTTENQILLGAAHREVLTRRLDKERAKRPPAPAGLPPMPDRSRHPRARRS